jgi:hypothetical protein
VSAEDLWRNARRELIETAFSRQGYYSTDSNAENGGVGNGEREEENTV